MPLTRRYPQTLRIHKLTRAYWEYVIEERDPQSGIEKWVEIIR